MNTAPRAARALLLALTLLGGVAPAAQAAPPERSTVHGAPAVVRRAPAPTEHAASHAAPPPVHAPVAHEASAPVTLPSTVRLKHAPELVVFDWDGTLGDTYPQLRWIVSHAAADAGVTPTATGRVDPFRAVIDGAGLEVMFRRLAPGGTPEQERAFVDRFQHYTREAPAELMKLKPGVREELEALRAKSPGTKLAILSSRPQAVVEALAKAAGIEGMFAKVVGTGGSKIAEKPSPEGLELIARALAVDPRKSLMVGDTPMDVGAGKAAGMRTIALRDGMGTHEKLAAAHPDFLVDGLHRLGAEVLPSGGGRGRAPLETPAAPELDAAEMRIHQALGVPKAQGARFRNVTVLARQGFVSVYDSERKLPLVVSWATTPAHLGESREAWAQREDAFHEDTLLEAPQAALADYRGSGFHRGHMVRQGERPLGLDRAANRSTFSMVNIVPQSPNNNMGPWAHLEDFYRDQVFATKRVAYVQAGPVLEGKTGTIGDGVVVPSHTYKIVVIADEGVDLARVRPEQIGKEVKVFGVLMPNNDRDVKLGDAWTKYLVPVSEIERRTGLAGFLAGFADPQTRKAAAEHRVDVRHLGDGDDVVDGLVSKAWMPKDRRSAPVERARAASGRTPAGRPASGAAAAP